MNPGAYLAIATINYDGKQIRLEQAFSVSNLVLSIKDVSVRDFNIGEIAVFDISLESMWNDEIKDVYAELEIYHKGTISTKFKTASVNIGPLGKANLLGYWDTKGMEEGSYQTNVNVYYSGKMVSKTTDMLVTMSGTHVFTPTAKAVQKEGFFTKETLLTSLVVILIAIVIVLIIMNLKWMQRRAPPPRGI